MSPGVEKCVDLDTVQVYNLGCKPDAELLRESRPVIAAAKPTKAQKSGRRRSLDYTRRHVVVALLAVGRSRAQAAKYVRISPEMLERVAECNSRFRYDMRKAELDYQTRKARRRLRRSLVDYASPDATEVQAAEAAAQARAEAKVAAQARAKVAAQAKAKVAAQAKAKASATAERIKASLHSDGHAWMDVNPEGRSIFHNRELPDLAELETLARSLPPLPPLPEFQPPNFEPPKVDFDALSEIGEPSPSQSPEAVAPNPESELRIPTSEFPIASESPDPSLESLIPLASTFKEAIENKALARVRAQKTWRQFESRRKYRRVRIVATPKQRPLNQRLRNAPNPKRPEIKRVVVDKLVVENLVAGACETSSPAVTRGMESSRDRDSINRADRTESRRSALASDVRKDLGGGRSKCSPDGRQGKPLRVCSGESSLRHKHSRTFAVRACRPSRPPAAVQQRFLPVQDHLAVNVYHRQQGRPVFREVLPSPLEFGRQRQEEQRPYYSYAVAKDSGTRTRVVIGAFEEVAISRQHLAVELAGHQALLKNESTTARVDFADREPLMPGQSCEVPLPCRFMVADKAIALDLADDPEESTTGSLTEVPIAPGNIRRSALEFNSLPLESMEHESILRWLQSVLHVLQSAASSSDFFDAGAQAVVDIGALDVGAVIMLDENKQWKVRALKHREEFGASSKWAPSQSTIEKVRNEKRTFWQLPEFSPHGGSLIDLQAVISAPILSANSELIGVLYGERHRSTQIGLGPQITKTEAMLIETIAYGVAAGLARLAQEQAALGAQVRFEQFFSERLAKQLQAEPNLLEGKDLEVSVLFCDIRGFSRVS